MSFNQKLNVAREFLQIICLKIISEKNIFNNIAFVGGTSLRILFDLKRFSEDLDFSLIKQEGYDFKSMQQQIEKSFHLYNLSLETKAKTSGNINAMLLKFPGLLKELGISGLAEQRLSIKIEIDINPPSGWQLINTIVNKVYMFNILHYDLASLYASKLHACFFRRFVKGRDFYDFVWYLGKKIEPNFILLNNAIKQTHNYDPAIKEESFKDFLLEKIQGIDFSYIKKDVERFLEDKNELNIFDKKIICDTIQSVY